MRRLFDWLEDRSGYRAWLKTALDEPVPGGASWAFVFGSVVTFILVLQIVTGIVLATYYSPSSSTAWASVAYVQDQVSAGWFVRGLHSKGASAMVVVTGLHMLQVFVYGAYKKPRELNWLVGLAMFGLILAFALTGYLLPWDQKGYNATKVATNIIGDTPLIGRWLQSFVLGGNDYGNLTLTRFYAAHVILLPGALLGLLGLHLALFRRHGVTPRWGKSDEYLVRNTQPFWPDQLYRDALAMLLCVGVLVGLTVIGHGVELSAPADPSKPYEARPEWYFLPLFQLLKYFSGGMSIVGSMLIPGVAVLFLVVLPFLDRGESRDPNRRLPWLASFFTLGGATVLLGYLAQNADENNAHFKRSVADAELQAHLARSFVKTYGYPEGGRVPTTTRELAAALKPPAPEVDANDPKAKLDKLWAESCLGCHTVRGKGDGNAPDLAGYNTRPWLRAFLENPTHPLFFGRSKNFLPEGEKKGMKPVKATPDELVAITEWVYSLQGPELAPDVDTELAKRGLALYESDAQGCTNCHSIVGQEEGEGPNLASRGTRAYLAQIIADAGVLWLYGTRNEMKTFKDKLTAAEIDEMVARVLELRKMPVVVAPP